MSVQVFSVRGHSGSGKTRLVEQLLPHLVAAGVRVGTIKHASHTPTLDVKGKDSHRHAQAGAARVLLLGPETAALFIHDGAAPELAPWLPLFADQVELVVVEGFKRTLLPSVTIEINHAFELIAVDQAPGTPTWTLRRPRDIPSPFGFPEELVGELAAGVLGALGPGANADGQSTA